MSLYFGFGLEYRFEVTAISIGWLTLMISGSLLVFAFRRHAHPPSKEGDAECL